MQSRAKILGHAVHPMLIAFPLGLLVTAVIFDIVFLVNGQPGFATASAYMIAAGVIGGLVAAVPGLIDWLAIPTGTRAKRIGLVHGIGNVVVVLLFAISWLLRLGAPGWTPSVWALICSFAGVVVGGASAWLGGELVERLSVGVDDGANVNAPNSLTWRRGGAAAMTRQRKRPIG
ncbi:DUF2231 domain-containing protein [Fodinicola acaciae]|uniref:DUF2231 domain-containing protein n=1 Tax=Fodinicola acaciae TaxID=2681555 RepID=UPI0013D87AD8|nr:DUF2231 domain-containing protein [Fodinicola acaciae]